jgi:sugar lactone lactonase YvrE
MKSFVSLAVIAISPLSHKLPNRRSGRLVRAPMSCAAMLGISRSTAKAAFASRRDWPRSLRLTNRTFWSSAFDAAGNVYLGTGGDGKVFKVAGGAGSLFADLAEMNVTALAVGRAGEIFAATSPDGKVYRIDQTGKPAVYFDAKEKYIWSLAIMGDGSLAVGTGESGKIYRVKTANATPESSLLFDTSDSHIICLTTDKAGNLYAGTDSNGLVLRFGADGKPFRPCSIPRSVRSINFQSGLTVLFMFWQLASQPRSHHLPEPDAGNGIEDGFSGRPVDSAGTRTSSEKPVRPEQRKVRRLSNFA